MKVGKVGKVGKVQKVGKVEKGPNGSKWVKITPNGSTYKCDQSMVISLEEPIIISYFRK